MISFITKPIISPTKKATINRPILILFVIYPIINAITATIAEIISAILAPISILFFLIFLFSILEKYSEIESNFAALYPSCVKSA